ncbi:hypothetical protein ACPCHT_37995 [Nucisporomicrobium flavum]|uniref:hypothetical protein n=1 Tax=Nucisporomicrobium flavum TaxID=2785915 RepID=UPI003C2FC208
MVLAEAEYVNADLVSKYRLVNHVADDLGVRQQLTVRPDSDVTECVQAEFHARHGVILDRRAEP